MLQHWSYDHPDFPGALGLPSPTHYHYFDVRGIVRVFSLQLDDTGWRMVYLDEDFSQRHTARFRGPHAMNSTGERFRDAGATWQPDFTMTFQRVG